MSDSSLSTGLNSDSSENIKIIQINPEKKKLGYDDLLVALKNDNHLFTSCVRKYIKIGALGGYAAADNILEFWFNSVNIYKSNEIRQELLELIDYYGFDPSLFYFILDDRLYSMIEPFIRDQQKLDNLKKPTVVDVNSDLKEIILSLVVKQQKEMRESIEKLSKSVETLKQLIIRPCSPVKETEIC